MTRILFAPFSIIAGFLAGKIATMTFEHIWRLVDDEKSPEPGQRRVRWPKLLGALVLEGAIFRAVRGMADRGAREAFHRMTGSWPGEEAPSKA